MGTMLLRPRSWIRLSLVVLALAPTGGAEPTPTRQRGSECAPSLPTEPTGRTTGGVSDGDDWLG